MTVYGNTVKSWWRVYLDYTVDENYSDTQASITFKYGINFIKAIKGNNDNDGNYQTSYDRPTFVSCTTQTTKNYYPTAKLTKTWYNNGNRSYQYGTAVFYVTKTQAPQTITLKASSAHTTSSTTYSGTSAVSVSITIPARESFAVTYNQNTVDTVTNFPENALKYYDYDYTISSVTPLRDNYIFDSWNTASDGTGTAYAKGDTYSTNAAVTLYAQWEKVFIPPIIDNITINRVETAVDTDLYDEGDYICVTLGNYVSGDVPADGLSRYKQTTMTLDITENGNTHTLTALDSNSFTGAGTDKHIHFFVPTAGYSPSYPTDTSYPITLTFTTVGYGSTTVSTILSSSIYPIDIASDASIMAFGVPIRCKSDFYIDVDQNAPQGTTDQDLYTALDALGWWNDVNV